MLWLLTGAISRRINGFCSSSFSGQVCLSVRLRASKRFATVSLWRLPIFASGLISCFASMARLSWLFLLGSVALLLLGANSVSAQTATGAAVTPPPSPYFGPTLTLSPVWSTLTPAPTDENGCPQGGVSMYEVDIAYQLSCPICINDRTPEPNYGLPTSVLPTAGPFVTSTSPAVPTLIGTTFITPEPTLTPTITATPDGPNYPMVTFDDGGFTYEPVLGSLDGSGYSGNGWRSVYSLVTGGSQMEGRLNIPISAHPEYVGLKVYTPGSSVGGYYLNVCVVGVNEAMACELSPEIQPVQGWVDLVYYVGYPGSDVGPVSHVIVHWYTGYGDYPGPDGRFAIVDNIVMTVDEGSYATSTPTLTPTATGTLPPTATMTPIGFVDCSKPHVRNPQSDAEVMGFDPQVEYVFTECYRIIPELNFSIPGSHPGQTWTIEHGGTDLCLMMYALPSITIFGFVITPTILLLYPAAWVLRRLFMF